MVKKLKDSENKKYHSSKNQILIYFSMGSQWWMSLPNCQRMNIKLTFKFEKTVYEFIGNVFPFLEEIRFYNQSFTKNM